MHNNDLFDFIDTIFPDDLLAQHEHVCYWASRKAIPGFPVGEKGLERALKGTGEKAMYFGTSTVTLTEGALRNRQSAFSGLWCVVLDDIGNGQGAKCSTENLPPGLWAAASYRVETSPDNFQLGFVLDQPIRDVEAAREFVRLIYNAGPWDSGGAMPTKLVRLPAGVNLKDKYDANGAHFHVRLDHLSDVIYTPDELLQLVDAGIGWEDILNGESDRKDPRRGRGTTPYRGGARMDIQGVVDPFLEWLNDNELIVNERYPFVDVVCPWHEEHTEGGGTTAGYSPLGWGEEHHRSIRGFKCFHDHCRDRGAREFIDWGMGLRAPPVAVHDPIAPMLSKYVLDCKSLEWVDIRSESLHRLPDKGFRAKFAGDTYFPKPGKVGEWAFAPIYNLIIKNPGTLKVDGSVYEPGDDLIVTEGDDCRFINDCRMPWHGSCVPAPGDIERFRDFIKYLLPDLSDAEFLIRHLAMKVQNPHYRGPAIFMHTPTQGSGRGTLGRMLGELWGDANVRHPSMKTMLKGLSGDGFNTEIRGLWLVVSESRSTDGAGLKVSSEQYESFKAFVEPAPTKISYNRKWGGQWTETNYSSVIVCSNHSDGMILDIHDRRVRKMRNVVRRRPVSYFNALHEWISEGSWRASVWQYLADYDCGTYTGTEPVDDGTDPNRMDDILASQSPMDLTTHLVQEYLDANCGGLVQTKAITDALQQSPTVVIHLGLDSMRVNWLGMLPKIMRKTSTPLGKPGKGSVTIRVAGVPMRFRTLATETGATLAERFASGDAEGAEIAELWSNFRQDALLQHLQTRLEEMGLG